MLLNPHDTYTDPKTKHFQVVFLALFEKVSAKKIAEITNYAVSTVKTYIRKFKSLLEEAKTIFFSKPEVIVECKLFNEAKEKCYLFKFYDEQNKIIFSKIGTTTRKVKDRLKEEIKSYRKSGINIYAVKICSVFDCKGLPAEGAESICRAEFIKKFPNTFKKNDRFMNVDIPTSEFAKIVEGYLV